MLGTESEMQPEPGLIFLSHASADTKPAKELAWALRQAGLEVWLDADCLQPGDIWADELERALQKATAFVVYVGQLGVLNWVGREVRYALDRNTKDASFRLIPILGQGAQKEGLPPFLSQQQYIDLREGLASPEKLKELIGGIKRQPRETVGLLSPQKCPYRGLLPFETEDALLFYGREAEILGLLGKLATDRFLAVVGDSGSGKSSLVKAGLIPALHRGGFSFPSLSSVDSWRVVVVTPGDDPLRSLAEALPRFKPELTPAESIAAVAEIKKQFSSDRDADSDALRNAIAGLQLATNCRPLLVIDQFEELFALAPRSSNEDERERHKQQRLHYIDLLLAAASNDKSSGVLVVLTLRADFYSYCWDHPTLPQRIAANQFSVLKMTREQLRLAIENPLALAGARAEPGLVDALLSDAGDEPGNLPLVEHALRQLWEKRASGLLTNVAYEEMGRLKGSLKNYAEQTYAALPNEAERAVAHKIFVRLTQLGEGAPDTRRRVKKSELVAFGSQTDDAEQVLNKLASARLITISTEEESSGAASGLAERQFVEVAHEALIREWPRLQSWVSDDRQDLRIARSIIQAAAEWEIYHHDRGTLLQGARLLEAEEWAMRHPEELPSSATQLLKASVTARDEMLRMEEERREAEQRIDELELQLAQRQAEQERRRAEESSSLARKFRRLTLVLGFALFATVVSMLYLVQRFTRSRPVDYADDAMHFMRGSTGGETMNGIPYWIWIALPEIFPEYLPDRTPGRGYSSFGMIYEPGADPRYALPLGMSMRNLRGIDVVYLNCGACHIGTVRDKPGATPRIIPGMPAHQFDIGALGTFLTGISIDQKFTPQRVVSQILAMQDDPNRLIAKPDFINRLIFKYAAVSIMRDWLLQSKQRLTVVDGATWGPGRIDVFNAFKALLNFPMQYAEPRELIGNVDFPSIWNQGPRKGMQLHWDGNNTSVDERTLYWALVTGAFRQNLDVYSVLRMAKYLESAKPPPYAYPIDAALAAKGAPIYQEYCASCHGTREAPFRNNPPHADEHVGTVVPIAAIGTDRWRLDSYTWELAVNQSTLYAGYEKDWGFDKPYPQRFTHFRKTNGYANMPLDGIWLRAPYLHNGSVPNLRELLEPATSRSKIFYRGNDVFDPENVGFVSNVAEQDGRKFFRFDTMQKGNGNAGHEGTVYGTSLPSDEKRALLEYLKTF